ncbi:uncharacterized protein LOC135331220 isoform X2 [Halichondria panicea]
MTPCIRFWKTLSGHDRTPWVLTFDPSHSHILYSGSLDGKVCKWNIYKGGTYVCSFNLDVSSPVNSITPLPTHPYLLLVAVKSYLCLLSSADLSEVWRTQTEPPYRVVRLVQHHPFESKIIVATSTIPDEMYTGPTTYTLGLHFFHKNHPPALTRNEDPIVSLGDCSTTPTMARNWRLVCTGARVLSPHSFVTTTNFVISIIHKNSAHKLCLYSILDDSCGVCLHSFLLARDNLVSVDLSPCSGYLLLGFVAQRSTFHYESRVPSDTEIRRFSFPHRLSKTTDDETLSSIDLHLERVYSIPSRGSNVAVWMPLAAGHGYGACIGTAKGGNVLFWRALELFDSCTHHSA